MKNKKVKICHMTSAHRNLDDRIYLKECISLANVGYDTFLVAQGETFDRSGVHMIGVGTAPQKRLRRIFSFSRKIYKRALELDCAIYHFHDPELLPYGLKLKKKGKKVIFDSHEDVSAQIQDKEWIPLKLRKLVSSFYKRYETHVVRQLDAVVAATDHIAETFKGRAKKIVVINNYPKLDDIVFNDTPFTERAPIICYAGGISELRGEKVMIEAMKGVNATLVLAGPHEKSELVILDGGGELPISRSFDQGANQ